MLLDMLDTEEVAQLFADPDYKISFGYLTNKLGGEYLINARAQSLITEVYKCLD